MPVLPGELGLGDLLDRNVLSPVNAAYQKVASIAAGNAFSAAVFGERKSNEDGNTLD